MSNVLHLLHDDAMLIVPGVTIAVVTARLNSKKGWFGHPKTRRLNTEEHAMNARQLEKAVRYSRIAAATAIKTDNRLTDHIENHPS